MNALGVVKAQSRLTSARRKLEEAANAQNYADFSEAWYFFLIAAKNVYTTLEQAAKDNARCRQWFGAKKQERKTDPLLQYLFQARDDDEHGLSPVTQHHPGSVAIGTQGPGLSNAVYIENLVVGNGQLSVGAVRGSGGLPVGFHHTPSRITLKPVTARGPVIFQPPTMHLGVPISDSSPIGVGSLALTYLERLLEDARALAS